MCRKIINYKNTSYLLAFLPKFLDMFHIKKSIKHFFFRVILSNNSTRLYQNPRNRFAKTLRSAFEWFIEFFSHDLITLRFKLFQRNCRVFPYFMCQLIFFSACEERWLLHGKSLALDKGTCKNKILIWDS